MRIEDMRNEYRKEINDFPMFFSKDTNMVVGMQQLGVSSYEELRYIGYNGFIRAADEDKFHELMKHVEEMESDSYNKEIYLELEKRAVRIASLELNDNYFAIDDPYGDGQYRCLYLVNDQVRCLDSITYTSYQEAVTALKKQMDSFASRPHNKANSYQSVMVSGRAALEAIAAAKQAFQQRVEWRAAS